MLPATSVTFTDVALAWNPSSDNVGVDGYRILVDSQWWSYSYQPDSGTVGNLLPGHTYSIAVQVQDHAGNVSPASAPITVSTPADTEPPTAPTGLSSDFAGNGVFGLTWVGSTDNADQTKYLKYDVYADGGLVYVASGNETSIYVCLAPGTYTFVVRARDRSGNVSASSNPVTVTG
ncbi:MAG TPA: hypothetical protein VN960_00090 [Gaiellaceae bacterium]|nr:hypothetical protein [Gaiellaceae bacterium]